MSASCVCLMFTRYEAALFEYSIILVRLGFMLSAGIPRVLDTMWTHTVLYTVYLGTR